MKKVKIIYYDNSEYTIFTTSDSIVELKLSKNINKISINRAYNGEMINLMRNTYNGISKLLQIKKVEYIVDDIMLNYIEGDNIDIEFSVSDTLFGKIALNKEGQSIIFESINIIQNLSEEFKEI